MGLVGGKLYWTIITSNCPEKIASKGFGYTFVKRQNLIYKNITYLQEIHKQNLLYEIKSHLKKIYIYNQLNKENVQTNIDTIKLICRAKRPCDELHRWYKM